LSASIDRVDLKAESYASSRRVSAALAKACPSWMLIEYTTA
jgi:hypothetical protein